MLIKKSSKNEIKKLITLIKQAVLDNRNWFAIPKSKFRFEKLLKILVNQGFIESYEESHDLLIIRLKHTYWKAATYPTQSIAYIKPITRVRRKSSIEARDLAKAQRLQGQTWDFFASTDKGVLIEKENRRYWRGGMPLFKIL